MSEGDEAGIIYVHFFVVFLEINCLWTREIPATLHPGVEKKYNRFLEIFS